MGKILLLSFKDEENEILSKVLNFLGNENHTYNMEEHIIEKELIFDGIIIDLNRRLVMKNNKKVSLTYIEFEIILLLARNPERVFSKEQIYDMVWREPYSGDYSIVMSHIRNIREKIEDAPSSPQFIQTVWGAGYRFNPYRKSNS